MMLRTATAMLALMGATAHAAPVEVRSGEHEDFTRIIVDLPARTDVRINQDDTRVIVTLGNKSAEFDLRPVFDKIPRDRLQDITSGPEPGSLALELGCACVVTSFWHGLSLLVLDIRPGTPEPLSVPATPAQSGTTALTDQKNRKSAPGVSTLQPARATFAGTLFAAQFPEAAETSDTAPGNEPAEPPDPANTDTLTDDALRQSRDRLLRQIGRAASQGLLTPKSTLPEPQLPGRETAAQAARLSAGGQTRPEPLRGIATNINLRAESSVDRDFATWRALNSAMPDGSACLPPRQIDVAAWGSDAGFGAQIGPIRARLSGEFDRTNQQAVEELVRLYLYFGFGAEASRTLRLLPPENGNLPVFKALANIMENGVASQPSALAAQLACDGPAALWSALSYPGLPADQPADTDAILLGFAALPPHLRSQLGPDLSRRLAQAGHREAASGLLRILNRSPATKTARADLASADLALDKGPSAAADATLQSIAESGEPSSVKALTRLVENRFAAGEDISFEQAQLVGAYAHERRGAEDFPVYFTTYITALAASGAYDLARDEIARLGNEANAESVRISRSRLVDRLTKGGDDVSFLKQMLAQDEDDIRGLDAQVANAASDRLLSLGFPESAQKLVVTVVEGSLARERRILRARAALALDRPRQAEAELLGLDGKDINRLRAEARSRVGQYGAAYQLFASGDLPQRAMREAWLDGNWNVLRGSEDPAIAAVAQLAGADAAEQTTAPDIGVLAQNRQLLDQSNATRETVTALLQALTLPDTPE